MRRAFALLSCSRAVISDEAQVAIFYHLIAAGDPELAESLHKPVRYRPFAFGVRPVPGGLGALVTSLDPRVVRAFVEGCARERRFALGGATLRVEECCYLPDEPPEVLNSGRLDLWCVSPVTISRPQGPEGRKRCLVLHEQPEMFEEALAGNLRRKTQALLGIDPGEVTVRFERRYFAGRRCAAVMRLYGGSVIGFRSPCVVEGPPAALEVAVYAGLGERTGSGCGAVLRDTNREFFGR
jgi:CRISPR-associated endoribonuclease Cas6